MSHPPAEPARPETRTAVPPPSLSPFRPTPRWQRVLRSVAIFLSIGVHVVFAALLMLKPEAAKKAATWVEMTVVEAKPPPPPPPPEPEPPKPEPEKKKAPPKAVKFEDIPPRQPEAPPPPDAPPPPKERVVRRVQGLSANSFAPGANTGLSVRAGNTTAMAAGKDTMGLDEATGPYVSKPYTAVTNPPKPVSKPAAVDVPDEARKAGVEGVVEVKLDIGPEGNVLRVLVVKDLGHGTGDACAAAWRKSRWKPAMEGGVPIAVLGYPQICTIRREE